jgi:hypothetical protein
VLIYREYFALDLDWMDLIAVQANVGQIELANRLAAIKDDVVNPALMEADQHFRNSQATARRGEFDSVELSKGLESLKSVKRLISARHADLLDEVAAAV